MALIKCPECEKEISDKAKTCIHCGYHLSVHQKKETLKDSKIKFEGFIKKSNVKKVIYIFLIVLILFFCFSTIRKQQYRNFSGEYRVDSGSSEIAPIMIDFNEDGTGSYYIGGGVLTGFYHLFDYKIISKEKIKIYDCWGSPPIHYINGECLVYSEDEETYIILSEFPDIIYEKVK